MERNYDTYVVAAPVKIGSNDHIALAVVESHQGAQGKSRYYLHEVVIKEKLGTFYKTGVVAQNEPTPGNARASLLNVLQSFLNVNNEPVENDSKPTIQYAAEPKIPIDPEGREVMDRLARGENVPLDEIYQVPAIAAALKRTEGLLETIDRYTPEELAKRKTRVLADLDKMGSAQCDKNGKWEYTGPVGRDRRVDIAIGPPAAGKSSGSGH